MALRSPSPPGRSVSRAAALAALGLALLGPAAGAQTDLPAVGVVLVLEIRDPDGWLRMHHEILATAPASPKPLVVMMPARTGGSRALVLAEPKFAVAITLRGPQLVRLVVRGKLAGTDALQALPPFVHSLSDASAGSPSDRVTLEYGLASLAAELVELKIDER